MRRTLPLDQLRGEVRYAYMDAFDANKVYLDTDAGVYVCDNITVDAPVVRRVPGATVKLLSLFRRWSSHIIRYKA